MISYASAGAQDALRAYGVKAAEFALFGVTKGTAAGPQKNPEGAINPDNGKRTLGTNFDLPRTGGSRAVGKAFNDLNNGPKNQDFVNGNNEGLVGATP